MDDRGIPLPQAEPFLPREQKVERLARRLGLGSARDLLRETLPEIHYVVPGYIAEGLTLFGGKPKIGKSWLLLGVCIAVALGGVALGNVPVQQGDVLYLALEDNKRRLQKRLRQLLMCGEEPERLHYDLACGRLDAGGVKSIRDWIKSVINPRLVVIDVLNKVRPAQKGNEGIYDYDVRSLESLHSLAGEFGIAIVVVHHTRKAEAEDPFDCLSGSTGLTGTADTTLVLTRDGQGVTLYGRGRDIEEIEMAMSFDKSTGAWTALGRADDVRRSDSRSKIVTVLQRSSQPMTPREVADEAGLNHANVRQTLLRMARNGEAEKAGPGRYTSPKATPLSH